MDLDLKNLNLKKVWGTGRRILADIRNHNEVEIIVKFKNTLVDMISEDNFGLTSAKVKLQ